jgi:ketosteroid isomerase-like protein
LSTVREQIDATYKAFGAGDLPGVLAQCDDGITFTVPGAVSVSGDYTKATFVDLVVKIMTTSGGTFREEILDILEGEKFVGVWLDHSFTRGGEDLRYRTLHLWGIGENGFTSWREIPEDLHLFEYAWRAE